MLARAPALKHLSPANEQPCLYPQTKPAQTNAIHTCTDAGKRDGINGRRSLDTSLAVITFSIPGKRFGIIRSIPTTVLKQCECDGRYVCHTSGDNRGHQLILQHALFPMTSCSFTTPILHTGSIH
jgi:hypothetical protein